MRELPALLFCMAALGEPLRLHPDNPHYFLFNGKPTILITSGEHYGAVLNGRFDYRKYLDTLAADRLNLTRIFTGLYREVPGESFGITRNVLAPEEADFVQPFRRVSPGRYDLNAWNDAYFTRLRDFVAEAGKRGIVVEVTLFTTYYNDKHWAMSPLNAVNNLQGIGKVGSTEVLALKEKALTEVQDRVVAKIVSELNSFENVYFEICNEPYFHGVTSEWQRHVTDVIVATEARLPNKHLLSWNIANGRHEVRDPHPAVSIFNFHYARPPQTVGMNYGLGKVVGNNETGFDGTHDSIYRIQGWEFIMAGGALYNNLDYSFVVGQEDGMFVYPGTQPGGGSSQLRKQLRVLREFTDTFDFVSTKPAPRGAVAGIPEHASAYLLANPGRTYALYLHHGRPMPGYRPQYIVGTNKQTSTVGLELPAGTYRLQWWNPRQGRMGEPQTASHSGGMLTLTAPEYSEDIALTVISQ